MSGPGVEGAPRALRGPALPHVPEWWIGAAGRDAHPAAALGRRVRLTRVPMTWSRRCLTSGLGSGMQRTATATSKQAATSAPPPSTSGTRERAPEAAKRIRPGCRRDGFVAEPRALAYRARLFLPSEPAPSAMFKGVLTPLCPPSLRPRSPSPLRARTRSPRRSRTRPPAPLTLTRTAPAPRRLFPSPPPHCSPTRPRPGRSDTRIPNRNGSSELVQPSSWLANRAVPACGSHPFAGSVPTF